MSISTAVKQQNSERTISHLKFCSGLHTYKEFLSGVIVWIKIRNERLGDKVVQISQTN